MLKTVQEKKTDGCEKPSAEEMPVSFQKQMLIIGRNGTLLFLM